MDGWGSGCGRLAYHHDCLPTSQLLAHLLKTPPREEAAYCHLQTHNYGPWTCTHLRRHLCCGVHWLLDLLHLPTSVVYLLSVDGGGREEAHGRSR
jgi:hypothetical protein